MEVRYRNKKWYLVMSYMMFQSLQRNKSNYVVQLEEITTSSYKEHTSAQISDLMDESIFRNMDALAN